MAFGVFIHRADSIYEDSPAERYQFPKQYLGRVAACLGDWIVYYEPTKVSNSKGYFAVAKVADVVPDLTAPGMFFALIESGTYLDFADPVPFSGADGVVETGLLNAEGRVAGPPSSCRQAAFACRLSADRFARTGRAGLAPPAPRSTFNRARGFPV